MMCHILMQCAMGSKFKYSIADADLLVPLLSKSICPDPKCLKRHAYPFASKADNDFQFLCHPIYILPQLRIKFTNARLSKVEVNVPHSIQAG